MPVGQLYGALTGRRRAECGGPCLLASGIFAKSLLTRSWPGARSSAGEHYVDIVGVTGSIPVAPTMFFNNLNNNQGEHFWADLLRNARNKSGELWKRLGRMSCP